MALIDLIQNQKVRVLFLHLAYSLFCGPLFPNQMNIPKSITILGRARAMDLCDWPILEQLSAETSTQKITARRDLLEDMGIFLAFE
jgi:hypothetical protein